mgnify:FL=1
MNEKRLKRYISNLATAYTFPFDSKNTFNFTLSKCQKYFLSGLRNYCKLRLDLMSKQEVIQVEQALATAAVKAGVRYAVQKYNINLGSNTVDEVVDKILPEVLDDVHNLRYDVLTTILGYCDSDRDRTINFTK